MIGKVKNNHGWYKFPWTMFRQKSSQHLPRWLFILALVLLMQSLAEFSWRFISAKPEIKASDVSLSKITVPAKPSTSLKDVAALHLFGDAKKLVPVQQKLIDAPDTRLRLDLKGVFAATDQAKALAIISSSRQRDKTYHIGDKITGGAELHAVYGDRVILKRNNRLETLRLPKSKLDNNAIKRSVTQPQNTMSRQISHLQKLRDMRNTLVKDPAKIWRQVRINPVMKNGKVQGYTLAHNDQSLMKAMKLRKTDIITGINGQSLSEPTTLYGVMATLTEQPSIELTVQRNGQEQTIMLIF